MECGLKAVDKGTNGILCWPVPAHLSKKKFYLLLLKCIV